MKLGGSLQRRRGRSGRRRGGARADGGGKRRLGWGRTLLYGVGLAVFGWTVGYLGATQILFPAPDAPSDLVTIPDLRGIGPSAASDRLGDLSLSLGHVDTLRHPSVAEGIILGQSPLPGQLSLAGGDIRVTVSRGPQRRAVPDVRRLAVDGARVILETTGFSVTLDSVQSELPRGRVVSVTPPVDSVVVVPGQVRLSVSTGPPVVIMPRLLGMDRSAALATLDSLGLIVSEVEEVFRFGRDQDRVVEQDPGAGSEIPRGGAVRLAVGRGRGGGA